jgi:hypothetical protein
VHESAEKIAEEVSGYEEVSSIHLKGMGKALWSKFSWNFFEQSPKVKIPVLRGRCLEKVILVEAKPPKKDVPPKSVLPGSLVTFHFSGKLENGTVFDSTYFRGVPMKSQATGSEGKTFYFRFVILNPCRSREFNYGTKLCLGIYEGGREESCDFHSPSRLWRSVTLPSSSF